MTDPLFVENEFQTLKKIISLTSSSRIKIERLNIFFNLILNQPTPTYVKAYSTEILPEYLELILNQSFLFTPFILIDDATNILLRIQTIQTNERVSDTLQSAISHLHTQKKSLSEFIVMYESGGAADLEIKRSKLFSSQSYVNIPMVEKEKLLTSVNSNYSVITKLFVDIYFATNGENEDVIQFHQHFGDEIINDIKRAVSAAKICFEKYYKISIKKKLQIICRLEDHSLISGESFLAGLALQIFFELIKLYQLRTNLLLSEYIAITANINEIGELLPVSERNLRSKIEACYFSKLNAVIVSKENEAAAKNILFELENSVEMKKKFVIYSVDTIHQMLMDRRLVHAKKVPSINYTVIKLWKQRRPIAATIFLLLLFIIGKMIYGPLDKNPAIYSFVGQKLVIKNLGGETLFEKIFENKAAVSFGATEKLVAFYDIDSDGFNEVFFIERQATGNPSIIHCVSSDGEKVLWEKEMKKRLIFPNDPVPTEALNSYEFVVGEIDVDSVPEVYVVSRLSGYFPSVISKMNALNGKIISEYIHDGNLSSLDILDLDEDGKKEILLIGMNNSLYSGVVVVLDPQKIFGYSPHAERHNLEGALAGEEKKYLTVPRTIVGQKLEQFGVLTSCNLEGIDYKQKKIRVSINDLHINNKLNQSPVYFIHFDFSLRPISVSTSTAYEYWAEFLYKNGDLNFLPNHTYLTSTLKNLKYWER